MASTFQPPPTFAEVILYDKAAKDYEEFLRSAKFNPIWLKWFVDLTRGVGAGGGGGGSGTVTSVGSGTGLTGGPITTSGSLSLSIPVTVANGGTGATSYTANEILFGAGTAAIAHSSDLTWSATTGLKTLKGISSPNAVGSQMFGPNITDAATTNPSQNTLIGDGANNPYTYVFGVTAIGYHATVSGNNGTAIGAGATAGASTCIAIGNGTTCSAANAVNVGPGNQLTAGLLAVGSSNIVQHSNAGGLGTTGVSTQAGELFWGNADGSGATNIPASFRLFGTGASAYFGLNLWRVNPTFIDATNATYKVRTVFSTYDAGGEREYMRADATGTALVNVQFLSGGDFVTQAAALATTATKGFVYIPTSAGAPTGVPTGYTGTVAMQYDTTNNNFYIYNGAWKKVALA